MTNWNDSTEEFMLFSLTDNTVPAGVSGWIENLNGLHCAKADLEWSGWPHHHHHLSPHALPTDKQLTAVPEQNRLSSSFEGFFCWWKAASLERQRVTLLKDLIGKKKKVIFVAAKDKLFSRAAVLWQIEGSFLFLKQIKNKPKNLRKCFTQTQGFWLCADLSHYTATTRDSRAFSCPMQCYPPSPPPPASRLTPPSSWLGSSRKFGCRLRWEWVSGRGGGNSEKRGAAAAFILTSVPGAAHTSWNSLNYTPSKGAKVKVALRQVSLDNL